MTVNYSQEVATERLGGFFRLLFRWRGSIYKHIFGEMFIFVLMYSMLSFIYRVMLRGQSRRNFEQFCLYCQGFDDYIPVTFIVGFYVVRVISRRWTQWENMPWPDRIAFDASVYINGKDVKSRMIRRTLVRYCNLGAILCFRDISEPVRRRFPHMDYLVVAGMITPKELTVYKSTCSKHDADWWIPYHWAYTLVHKAMLEGKLTEGGMMRLHDAVADLRSRSYMLFSHDWIPVPLVYSQVVTLSVYLYMVACLFGRQYLDGIGNPGSKSNIDLYVPLFTILQLVFYLGWLKVGEVLVNPLGRDADDFDVNYIIDRNLRTAYTIVDYACGRLPTLEKDVHWDSDEVELPHTYESKDIAVEPFVGSVAGISSGSTETLTDEEMLEQLINPDQSRTEMMSSPEPTRRTSLAAIGRSLLRLRSRQQPLEEARSENGNDDDEDHGISDWSSRQKLHSSPGSLKPVREWSTPPFTVLSQIDESDSLKRSKNQRQRRVSTTAMIRQPSTRRSPFARRFDRSRSTTDDCHLDKSKSPSRR